MMNKRTHFRDDGEYIIFEGGALEIYIPMIFFERRGRAVDNGSHITSMGLLPLRIFREDGSILDERTLNLPITINFYPEDTEEMNLTLKHDKEPQKYFVMKFNNNSKVCLSSAPKNVDDVSSFLAMMTSGNVDYVSYPDLLKVWLKNTALNSVSLGCTSVILEIIISEIYRNTKMQEERFGTQMGKNPKMNPYDYTAINMRNICARNSVFSALTFEDMDQMITSSLNMVKYKKKQAISPIEKIIKM